MKTEAEFIKELEAVLVYHEDKHGYRHLECAEDAHVTADNIVQEALHQLGFVELASRYAKARDEFWYS